MHLFSVKDCSYSFPEAEFIAYSCRHNNNATCIWTSMASRQIDREMDTDKQADGSRDTL